MKIIKLVLLSVIVLTATSCEETGVTSGNLTVNGQLTNGNIYLPDFWVEIQGQRVKTDAEGKFSVHNVSAPYDVWVSPSVGGIPYVTIYKNASSRELYLNFFPGNGGSFHDNYSTIITTLPGLKSNQRAISAFIPDNGEYVYCPSSWNTGSAFTEVRWQGSPNISGKLIIMYVTYQNDQTIISYDRYYERNISLTSLNHYNDTIPSGYPYINPVESHVSGIINNSLNNWVKSNISISFPNNLLSIYLEGITHSNSFDYIIPESLPVNFTLKVSGEDNISFPITKRSQIMLPGTTNNIISLFTPPAILTPQENDSVSFYGSPFNWNQSDGDGIYMLEVHGTTSGTAPIRIYTTSIEAIIPDLSSLGYTYLGNGTNYRFAVWKYYSFSGMDDFLTRQSQIDKYEGESASDYYQIRVY
jgi:hypothetical protein